MLLGPIITTTLRDATSCDEVVAGFDQDV